MSQTVQIDIPGHEWITSNSRLHHMAKARMVKAIRNRAHVAALVAKPAPMDRATVTVWVGYPSNRRQDPSNCEPTAKAAIDAVAPHLLPDDDAEHLTAVTFRRDEPTGRKGWYRIRLTFEEQA